MKKEISKEKLLEVIREKLEQIEMPKEIILDKCSIITNPKKFFDLHIHCIGKMQKDRISSLYSQRLKLALSKLNIDINEIAKQLYAQNN